MVPGTKKVKKSAFLLKKVVYFPCVLCYNNHVSTTNQNKHMTTAKPYIVVVRVANQNGSITEHEFNSIKSAQAFRETFSNWLIHTWITLDYDRK